MIFLVMCSIVSVPNPKFSTAQVYSQLQYTFDSISDEKCEALLMFSLYSNGKKIFSCESTQSPNVIQCLHGIRSITTMWVIVGHTFVISLMLPTMQLAEFLEVIILQMLALSVKMKSLNFLIRFQFTEKQRSSITFPLIISDSFFVISGLLQSIKLLNIFRR